MIDVVENESLVNSREHRCDLYSMICLAASLGSVGLSRFVLGRVMPEACQTNTPTMSSST